MSSDHTADQPTPAGSATKESVQDVIARAIFEFDAPDVDPNVEAHALSIRIQESLAAAGYRIAEAGAVTNLPDPNDDPWNIEPIPAVFPSGNRLWLHPTEIAGKGWAFMLASLGEDGKAEQVVMITADQVPMLTAYMDNAAERCRVLARHYGRKLAAASEPAE